MTEEKVRIAIDRGGTFTDCLAFSDSKGTKLIKLLSVDPNNYADAPTEGIRRLLEWFLDAPVPKAEPIPTDRISNIYMGTTVATNALLERKGQKHALLITKGFRNLIDIGNQTRASLFDLQVRKPEVLYSKVVEVNERAVPQWPDLIPADGSMVDASRGDKLVKGLGGDIVRIDTPLNEAEVTQQLQALYDEGYRCIAIIFLHSYTFAEHERRAAEIARNMGFEHVSVSSELQPMIRAVSRSNSTTADAYLTPEIKRYLANFSKGFKGGLKDDTGCRVSFMQSDGALVDIKGFSGLRAVLSGPAGGVVGFSRTSYDESDGSPVVGLDIGGTSTDVSRFGGGLEHVFESTTAGVTIQSAQLDINTVASGGSSMLFWLNGMFKVGPESASSHPGPACYRKGGPLTVTDANLLLGRLHVPSFPKIFGKNADEALDEDIVKVKFAELTDVINAESGKNYSMAEVAMGFISVANQTMARPIRALTETRGFSTSSHQLACFGGAGGQHACAIAAALGIHSVIVHKYSSVLSAYGMALADVAVDVTEPSSLTYSTDALPFIAERFKVLKDQAFAKLQAQGIPEEAIVFDCYANMRYQGSDTSLMIHESSQGADFAPDFKKEHIREFSFALQKPIVVDDLRVRATGLGSKLGNVAPRRWQEDMKALAKKTKVDSSLVFDTISTYFDETGSYGDCPMYRLDSLLPGTVVNGPAIILDASQTLLIHPSNSATILPDHVIIDVGLGPRKAISTEVVDPIQLSVFSNRFMGIAERMGRSLQRTAVSLQIKERLDFSCALFSETGHLVANAPNIPVHLGSMQYAVAYQAELHKGQLKPGDVLVSNHFTAGGTHLPDITVIQPCFVDNEIVFYVAARGHHTDIGGLNGNSMHPDSKEWFEEGASFVSEFLVRDGVFHEDKVVKIFMEAGKYPNCSATRRIEDNISDLQAQTAACAAGAEQIKDLFQEYGQEVVQFYMRSIRNNAEALVRELMKKVYNDNAGRPLSSVDYMDDGTRLQLKITIDPEDGSSVWDYTGCSPESLCNYNAPPSVVNSAMIYCLRSMVGTEMPLNAGVLASAQLIIPDGCILKPSFYAAVSSGNTETSQRLCDVIFRAFSACAGSQGCMNVFHCNYKDMTYGETICGGAGAGPSWVGTSGTHIHMTNTRITDVEVLEKRFPLLLREFSIREGSGGQGKHKGGDGCVRSFEFLLPGMHSFFIGERRVIPPYGMKGGGDGERGNTFWTRTHPDGVRRTIRLKPSNGMHPQQGDILTIHTPGGGAWGPLDKEATADPQSSNTGAVASLKAAASEVAAAAQATYARANGSLNSWQATQNSSA